MTKMSANRKAKKAVEKIERRNMSEAELKEYISLVQVCNTQHWRAKMIAMNTALIPEGADTAKREEAIGNVLQNSLNNWLSRTLVSCGIALGQSVNINTNTGEIVEVLEEEPKKKNTKKS